jgi:hypothetical protein
MVGRSTVDAIFSLRKLQKKCREQKKPLYIAFTDLTKAFDMVSRRGLFSLLQKIGMLSKTAPDSEFLSEGHAQYSLFQWWNI